MKVLFRLMWLLVSGLIFISCQKEYSEEGGGASGAGIAGGTLKGAAGECLPAAIQGVYVAGAVLNNTHYINVSADFTALGTYSISTDVVNGYSFSATGIAGALGVQVVQLKATAGSSPVTAGANTFTVKFGSSQCNIVVDVFPAGTANASLTIDCSGYVLTGTYMQNTPVSSSNTIQVKANVTVAGLYNISSNTVNGVSFSGSGFLPVGNAQPVTLTAATGIPTASGLKTYTIGAGSSTCNVDIDFAAGTGPPPGSFTWSFKANAVTYSGTSDEALYNPSQPGLLAATGSNPAGDNFSLTTGNLNGPFTTGTYAGVFSTNKMTIDFDFEHTGVAYTFDALTANGNITTIIDNINTTTKVITGRFSGTAINAAAGNANVSISEGTFTLHYQ